MTCLSIRTFVGIFPSSDSSYQIMSCILLSLSRSLFRILRFQLFLPPIGRHLMCVSPLLQFTVQLLLPAVPIHPSSCISIHRLSFPYLMTSSHVETTISLSSFMHHPPPLCEPFLSMCSFSIPVVRSAIANGDGDYF